MLHVPDLTNRSILTPERSGSEGEVQQLKDLLSDPRALYEQLKVSIEKTPPGMDYSLETALVDLFGGKVPNREIDSAKLYEISERFVSMTIAETSGLQKALFQGHLLQMLRFQAVLDEYNVIGSPKEFFTGTPVFYENNDPKSVTSRVDKIEADIRLHLYCDDPAAFQAARAELLSPSLIEGVCMHSKLDVKLQYLYSFRIAYPDDFDKLNQVLTHQELYDALSARLLNTSKDISVQRTLMLLAFARVAFADAIDIDEYGIVHQIYYESVKPSAADSTPVVSLS